MPLTAQTIATSGIGQTTAVSETLVTFTTNQLEATLPWPNTGNQMKVPGFLYLVGNVVYTTDSQGNVHASNPNKDGTVPV